MTDVQELKQAPWQCVVSHVSSPARQVAGGSSILHKTIQATIPQSMRVTVILDIHGYDCWPAIATMEVPRLLLLKHPCAKDLHVRPFQKARR